MTAIASVAAELQTALPSSVLALLETNSSEYYREASTASWATAIPSDVRAWSAGVQSTLQSIVIHASGSEKAQNDVMRIGAAIVGGMAGLLML